MNAQRQNLRVNQRSIRNLCSILSSWTFIGIMSCFNLLLFTTLILQPDIFVSYITLTTSNAFFAVIFLINDRLHFQYLSY